MLHSHWATWLITQTQYDLIKICGRWLKKYYKQIIKNSFKFYFIKKI